MNHEQTPIPSGPEGAAAVTAVQMARQLQDIYDGFTEAVRAMGSKAKGRRGKSKLAQSAIHWLAGSHVRTERDVLCDKFLQDVRTHLETLDCALEGLPAEEVQEALGEVAQIMSRPVPEASNSTTALMKRAMISQLIPYLPRLSREQLLSLQERLQGAYKKSQRLPVEQEVLKKTEALLK